MKMYELSAQHDSRRSFNGKAKVVEDEEGTLTLYSYDTPVARIKDGEFEKMGAWNCSQTTRRHVREFAKQNGFTA